MPDAPAPGFRDRPGHVIAIDRFDGRVRAAVAGIVIADSRETLLLRETGYPAVFYFPPGAVRFDGFLTQSDRHTGCPFKGQADYWTFSLGSFTAENIAWSYPDPFREAAAIAGHVAFYWDRMDSWFIDDRHVTAPPP